MAPTNKTPPSFQQASVVRTGDKIIIPENMTYSKAMEWLARMEQAEEEKITVHEIINAYALDGAIAFMKALQRRFGWTSAVPTPGFFGPNPPAFVGVPTGPNGETVQVIWGSVQIPNMTGRLETAIHKAADGRLLFKIGGTTIRRHAELVQEIAQLTRSIAATESIYKGKAISVKFTDDDDDDIDPINNAPTFMQLGGITRQQLILPAVAHSLVESTLLAPIRYTDACRRAGIPLKRGILLEGPYGVGKTLTANVTALTCEQNAWTFLYLDDVADLDTAIQFAKMYQPCVIFAEDIDRASENARRNRTVNDILNTIDGIDTKNSEIMVVVTTNHIDQIHQAMLRPGRLDAVIPVRAPDANAAERLVRLFSRDMLSADADLGEVGDLLSGRIPAVIREVVERSKLTAIDRTAGQDVANITPEDLIAAAQGMTEHLKLMEVKATDDRTEGEKAASVLAAPLADIATALALPLALSYEARYPHAPATRPNGADRTATHFPTDPR